MATIEQGYLSLKYALETQEKKKSKHQLYRGSYTSINAKLLISTKKSIFPFFYALSI